MQRDRILAAATQIFITRGYTGSSVQAIGLAAGVAKRTIYDLFDDKDGLFHAVCARLCETAAEFHFNAAVTDLSLRDILIDMATTMLDNALSPAATAFTRMLAVEALRFPELVVSVMEAGRDQMHVPIAGVFAELAGRKRIRPIEPSQAADIFYDAIVGLRPMRAVLGYHEPQPLAGDTAMRVDMFLRGYLEGEAAPG